MKRLLSVLLLLASIISQGQSVIGRQKVDQFKIDAAGTLTYGLTWTPLGYNNTVKTYPLIIFNHGWGDGYGSTPSISGLNNLLKPGFIPTNIANGWNGDAINPITGALDSFIVISPQGPSYPYMYGSGLKYILPDILSRYRVDLNRIYVTGLSAGGASTWSIPGSLDTSFIKQIAAIAPVATVELDPDNVRGISQSEEESQFKYLINKYSVKVWGIVGEEDGGQLQHSLRYHDSAMLLSPNPKAKLTVIVGAGHDFSTWGKAYDPLFRPVGNYYGSNASGAYTTVANTNGSTIRGTGVTRDSLNIYEWFLLWSRTTPPASNFSVTAGADQTISLPTNSVSLVGSATPGVGHTISSYAWIKFSGPSTYTITTPNSSSTFITGLIQGTYVFRLTATDNSGSTISDDVQIIVNPVQPPAANNSSPTVTVNSNQTIVLPLSTASLTSTALDPDGNATVIIKYWTKLFRPGQPLYRIGFIGSSTTEGAGPANPANTFVNLLRAYYQGLGLSDTSYNLGKGGTNVFNGVGWSFVSPGIHAKQPVDTINVRAILAKNPDVVVVNYPNNNADILTVPEYMAGLRFIKDTVNSVGKPCYITGTQPRSTLPEFNMTNRAKLKEINDSCRVQFGKYFLDFYDPIIIPGTVYIQPRFDAGDSLHVYDSGHIQFARIIEAKNIFEDLVISSSGITSPTSDNTTITGLINGVHKFQRGVFDQYGLAANAITTVTVTGTPTNKPPVSNAGGDQTITLPINQVTLNGSASSDPDGTISTYAWTKIGGPASGAITSASASITTVTGMIQGIYTFQLTVTDNSGAINTDNVQITVNKSSACSGVKRILAQNTDNAIVLDGLNFNYNPGDTLVIPYTGITWTYAYIINFHGQPGCPVTFINSGNSQVRFINGISLNNCSDVVLSGSGNSNIQYGFVIQDTMALFDNGGPGVAIQMKSRKVDVHNIFITRKKYGFWLKNEADCDTSINNWTIDSISVHDCSLRNIGSEGLYCGTTNADNMINHDRPVICNGVTYYYNPSKISNFFIYNNIIDSTGRPGIQVSNASTGMSEIYNNKITNIGTQFDPEQGNAISLGGYTRAYVHNNNIDHTYTDGMTSNGSGRTTWESNIVNHPGSLFGIVNNTVQALFIKTYSATPPKLPVDSAYATIINNQLGTSAAGREVYLADDYQTFGFFNYICGNTRISGGAVVIDATNSGADIPVPIHYFSTGCSVVVNQPPVANAGVDKVITLPVNYVTITGSGSDIDGGVISYLWTKISGPSTFTITLPNSAQTDMNNLVGGAYQFKLQVTDNLGATGVDTVSVLVNAAINISPVVNAGNTQTITLPTNSVTMAGSSSDADGTIASNTWTKISGGAATITTPTSLTTTITGLVQGTYVFRLTSVDNLGATVTSDVTIVVNAQFPFNSTRLRWNGTRKIKFKAG